MTDTPMTPDQPTPVELTEQQLDALSTAGNRALNDHYHEGQCHCDAWPASCVSSDRYFMGAWDTDAFAIGLPAVLGVWEASRNDRDAAQVAELRADNEALRDRIAELEAFAYGCDGEGCVLPHSSWCERAKQQAEESDGCTCPNSPSHAGYCWLVSPPRNEVDEMRKRIAELTAAPVDEAAELAEGAAELEAMRREHPAPCRVPDSPDCTCPLTPEQALRIERDRPETRTTHDCTLPLVRRLDCGHCPHEVCEDCDRCPHTCECAEVAS
ncbi:hypothetical protein OH791_33765 [Streptomyces anulatus]|uniref:hypothetical protein n=1 Tax=Streptomyces anulatus TaxID=1892 RepID=UPI00386C0523|nr:hypothetical protein OH791_33765 [Streptomyces anulatus]